MYKRLCGAAHKNVKEIAGPLVILQVITITFNVIQHLLNYILITFVMFSCGRGIIGQTYRTVGRGDGAPLQQPPPEAAYGSRWNFARRTRKHIGTGLGFYRNQLDLLRSNQVNISLLININAI